MWKGCKPKPLQIFAFVFNEFASAVFTLLLCSLSPNTHAWKPCKYKSRLKQKIHYGFLQLTSRSAGQRGAGASSTHQQHLHWDVAAAPAVSWDPATSTACLEGMEQRHLGIPAAPCPQGLSESWHLQSTPRQASSQASSLSSAGWKRMTSPTLGWAPHSLVPITKGQSIFPMWANQQGHLII